VAAPAWCPDHGRVAGVHEDTDQEGDHLMKNVRVVSVAEHAAETARLAGLGPEATVVLAEVAGAVIDGLLAFGCATGLVMMAQMTEAELTEKVMAYGCRRSWSAWITW